MSEEKVPAYGPARAKIMIVGEAPGKDEVREGRPFVGTAGKLMRQFMMQVGIDPSEVYMTNICKYRPPGNDLNKFFSKDGVPGPKVMEGLIELQHEIEEVKPNIIIAMGNFPNWALTGKAEWKKVADGRKTYMGISNHRGSLYPCILVEGYKVMSTFHPSYICREGMKDHGTWVADLQKAKEESAFRALRYPNPSILVYKNQETLFVTNPCDEDEPEYDSITFTREQLRQKLMDQDVPVTVDIEYVGRDLLCVGMTNDRDEAHVIVINQPSDIDYCREILTSGVPLNAQNAAFEASILEWHYRMNIMPHVAYDTMLAAHAANIELPKDLGYLTSIYTNQPYHKGLVDWGKVKRGQQNMDMVWKYNGIDTWTEHAIMEEQIKYDLDDPKIRAVFQHEMKLLPVLWGMSKRGIKIDTPALNALREQLTEELVRMQRTLAMVAGRAVNVKSKNDMNWLLFEHLELTPIKRNKTGPANDDKTLAALRIKAKNDQQVAVIDLIRDIRERRTLLSNFLDVGFDDDGRARGQYNPGGTNTGRLSSSKFYPTGNGTNQQNIPRDERVRSLYIADTGYEFAYADLERAESLVVAYLTHDPRMLADHAPGTDAHRSLASILFGKPEEEVTKEERYLGKQTRHAGNYMQGWKTFMTNVNQKANRTGVAIDAAEAKRLIGIYRDEHPFLEQWWRDIRQELWRSRQLFNLLGRGRTFYGHIDSILPEAVAFTPQSTVGDVLNVGLLALHGEQSPLLSDEQFEGRAEIARKLLDLGFQALNQVHDAVGYQYPIQNRDEVNPLVRQLLGISITEPKTYEEFTIPVEIQVGPDWGHLKLYTADLEASVHA